jgi:20S proteasome subunit alpha 7
MEKLVSSKLMKKDANKRIATVDRHVGVVRRIQSLAIAT